jgi:hypothetical protein
MGTCCGRSCALAASAGPRVARLGVRIRVWIDVRGFARVLLGLGPRALGAGCLMLRGRGLSPRAGGALVGLRFLLVSLESAGLRFLPQLASLLAATFETALALLPHEHPDDQQHHERCHDDENDFHATPPSGLRPSAL